MSRKDATVVSLLNRLRTEYGSDALTCADYWDADAFAVGLYHRAHPGKLIYLCTYGKKPGLCDCSLDYVFDQRQPAYAEPGEVIQDVDERDLILLARRFWPEGRN